jgi:hypothetical protein
MLRRLTQVLIALIVALAATMPASVRAMPMPAGMTGMDVQTDCPSCPDTPAGTNPDKMPTCPILACVGAVATLPSPALLPERVLPHAASYLLAPPVRWTGAPIAPDPFPPRPFVLV